MTVVAILSILAMISIPAYTNMQRGQRQTSAVQGFEGTLVALRNLALTGRRVTSNQPGVTPSLPSGFCLRIVDPSTIETFAYNDLATGTHAGVPDADDTITSLVAVPPYEPTPAIATPDLVTKYYGVRVMNVLLIDRAGVVSVAENPLNVCFTPPQARVQISDATTGARILPQPTVRFEFDDDSGTPENVLAVEVNGITGGVLRTDRRGATLAPPPTPEPSP